MPWFKVDDNLAFHHKAIAAGNAAMGLWARAGSFCASQLTDGLVQDHMLPQLGTRQQAKRLCEVGLWHRVDNGYQFHEWHLYQPTKAEVEERREYDRKRKAEDRAESRRSPPDVHADTERSPNGVHDESSRARPRPDPTRTPYGSTNAALDERFSDFWAAYPRRVAKGQALKAWRAALRRGADPGRVISAATGYANTCTETDPQFVKHPATWLNGQCYDDEQPEQRAAPHPHDAWAYGDA